MSVVTRIRSIEDVTVPFSPGEVWNVLADVAAYPDWWPARLEVRVIALRPGLVGTEIEVRPLLGRMFRGRIEEAEEPHHLRIRFYAGALEGPGGFHLTAAEDSTQVSYEIDVFARGLDVAMASRFLPLQKLHAFRWRSLLRNLTRRVKSQHLAAARAAEEARHLAAREEAERNAAREALRIAQEEAARAVAAKAFAQRVAEEAARVAAARAAEEEAARIAAEEEAARVTAKRIAEAARVAAKRAAEEAERKAVEGAARVAAVRAAEEKAARIAAEEEAARVTAKRIAEGEAARAAAKRAAEEAERKAAEGAARIAAVRAAEEKAARIAAEEEAGRATAKRIAEEEAVRAAEDAAVPRTPLPTPRADRIKEPPPVLSRLPTVLGAIGSWVFRGQSTVPASRPGALAPPRSSNVNTAQAYLEALSSRATPEEIGRFFADDVVQEEFPNRWLVKGAARNKDEVLEWRARDLSLYTALDYELRGATEGGSQVVMEVRFRGLVSPAKLGSVEEPERDARTAIFLKFNEGKIVRQRTYSCFEPWSTVPERKAVLRERASVLAAQSAEAAPGRGRTTQGSGSNFEIARSYLDALSSGADADSVAAFYANDAMLEEFPSRLLPGGASRNREGVRQARIRTLALMASERYELRGAAGGGSQVALEVHWTGVMGASAGPFAGEAQESHAAVFLRFRDGLIVRQRIYTCA